MAYVKLDTGILDSTLWVERECREVFITALLMAGPREFTEDQPQIAVRSLELTGFVAPAGWYGFVEAAGVGIIRRAMVEIESGMVALEKLGGTDPESRSKKFDGRRLIRVNGGYLVLNFIDYRDRDHTASIRAQRYRDRKRLTEVTSRRDTTPSRRDSHGDDATVTPSHPHVTQAEAEADTKAKTKTPRKRAAPAALVCVEDMVSEGVDRQHATDWLVNRKTKGLALTPTAWAETKAEAIKAGLSVPAAIRSAAANGWGGFKASWMEKQAHHNGRAPAADPFDGAA